jgi:phage-related minor tail protein
MADTLDTVITVGADTQGAQTNLVKLAKEITATGKAASAAGKTMGEIGDPLEKSLDAAEKKAAATKRTILAFANEAQRTIDTMQSNGDKAIAAQLKGERLGVPPELIAASVKGIKEASAASEALALSSASASNSISRTIVPRLNEMGMTAKGAAAAMRNVPAQFTDIIVSLQGGQAPMTVLLQQGGQLKDMFGGIGNAAKALGGYLLGLVNPYTILVASVGALSYAYIKGASESQAYNKALIATGEIAGVTADRLASISNAVSRSTGSTVGAASEALVALAGSTNIVSSQYERIAAIAVATQRATGVAVAETIKQFDQLGKDPVSATKKLNETTNYLTLAVYENVKSLDAQGLAIEAGVAAQNLLADSMEDRTPRLLDNIGSLETGWNLVTDAIKGAGDALLSIGRDNSASDIAQQLRAQIQFSEIAKANGRNSYSDNVALEGLKAELVIIEASIAATEKGAAATAAAKAQTQRDQNAAIAASERIEKITEGAATKQERLTKALKEYRRDLELIRAANANDPRLNLGVIARNEANIRDQYADKTKPKEIKPDSFLSDVAKAYTKTLEDLDKVQLRASASAEVLSKTQEILRGVQASPEWAAFSRQKQEQIIYTASLSQAEEDHAAALKEVTKANKEYLSGINNSANAIESKLQAMNDEVQAYQVSIDQNVSLARAIDIVAIARLQEELAKQMSFGDESAAKILQSEIDARKELAGLIDSKESRKASQDAAKDAERDWKKTADEINRTMTDALMRAFEGGASFAQAMRDTVVNMFKTMVLRPVISAVMTPISGGVNSLLGGAGGGSEALGLASNAYSLYGAMGGAAAATGTATAASVASAFASGVSSGAAGLSTLTAVNATTGLAVGGATATAGGIGASMGSAAAAIGPVGWAAIAVGAVLALRSSPISAQNTGDASLTTGSDGRSTLATTNGLSAQTATLASSLQDSYAQAASALGITLAQTNFATGSNSGRQGQNPNLAFASTVNGDSFQSGEISAADGPAVALAASRAVFNALKSSELPEYLSGAFDGITASTATQEQITASLAGAQALATFNQQLQALPFARLAELSYDATQGLIAAAGGLDVLSTNLGAYYANFFSEEEKRSQAIININAATLGSGLDAATATRETFRALVEAQDVTTASGQQTYAALLSVAGAFAGLVPVADSAATALGDLATANAKWQNQLDVLSGASTARAQALAADLAGATDLSTRSLITQVYAQEDLRDSTAALATALQNQSAANKAVQDSVAAASAELIQAAAADAMSYAATTMTAAQNAMNGVTRSVNALKNAASDLYKTQSDAINESLKSVRDGISGLTNLSSRLKRTLDGMRISGSESTNRVDAQATLAAALATARSGGGLPVDNAALESALSTLAQPSEKLFGSFEAYSADFYKTAKDIAALASLTDESVTEQTAMQQTLDAQLALLEKSYITDVASLESAIGAAQLQINALTGVDTSINSLSTSMAIYTNAISAAASAQTAAAQAAQVAASQAAATAAAKVVSDAAALSATLAIANAQASSAAASLKTATAATDLLASYQTLLNRSATVSEVTKGAAQFAGGQTSASIASGIASSTEGQVAAAYNLYLERPPEAGAAGALAGAIDSGQISMAGAISQIANSPEGTVMSWYRNHPDQLDRNPTNADRTTWVGALTQYGLNIAKSWFANAVAEGYGKPVRDINSFEVGTNFVPSNMQANIHQGERIIPAADNRELMARLSNPQANSDALLGELRALREEVRGLRSEAQATASHTNKTARLLDRAMPSGTAIATEPAL